MKKVIVTLAILAIAMPAVAGQIKVHKGWPTVTTLQPQQIAVIDVKMDVGYWVKLKNQDPFKVSQDNESSDPFHTYVGCYNSDVQANFDVDILASVAKASGSALGGNWSVTSGATTAILGGSGSLQVCIKGTKVAIENADGGSTKTVAKLTLKALPHSS